MLLCNDHSALQQNPILWCTTTINTTEYIRAASTACWFYQTIHVQHTAKQVTLACILKMY